MAEAVEGGATLAWRLLATLEGGSLVLATTALLAYTARSTFLNKDDRRPVRDVLITNTASQLGKELKTQLESHGCTVSTLTADALSRAASKAISETPARETPSKVDALIVVGAELLTDDLDGMTTLVTKDVYENLKLVESLAPRIRYGGYIVWACEGAGAGTRATNATFAGTTSAYEAVLVASLRLISNNVNCEAVWLGRCGQARDGAERLAEQAVTALRLCNAPQETNLSIRHAAHKVSEFIGKWLKIIH